MLQRSEAKKPKISDKLQRRNENGKIRTNNFGVIMIAIECWQILR